MRRFKKCTRTEKNNKISHVPKCTENLEVYHTASINFDFWGHSALFKMASKMAANFRTPSKYKKTVLQSYLTNSIEINRVKIIYMTLGFQNIETFLS